MSSFVYFKFKSQKDPTRVTIDGPHTDVWNLKREIINISRLGDGTDFDLKIYKENSDEEYTDDTEIIPKDSTVLARRLPASAPGKGRAARYVSGKPPSSAKPASAATKANAAAMMDSNMTEEERIQAMLKMTDAKWQAEKEEMSHDTRINFSGPKTKKANVPEGEPPHGYICYRCMKRGHWIQACPTNDDANFDKTIRVKKTTGIPRSMLQKVDQSEIENLDESQRQNVMVTAEGEYVLAQADKKTWQKFQDQKNANDQAKKKVQTGDKEIQELGLECPIDKRLFVDPVKTPCCEKTYCHECIENALLDNDLECPGCHTANVSLEALKPDEEVKNKIQEYQNKKPGDSPATPDAATPNAEASDKGSRPSSRDGSKSPKSTGSVAGRKRSASEATSTNLAVPAPAMKRQKSGDSSPATPKLSDAKASTASPANGVNATNEMQALMQSMNQMPSMPNMNMGFPGMMPFMPNMMNPMMMGMPNMNMNMAGMPNMNAMGGMPFVGMPNMNGMGGMSGMNGMNGMNGNTQNNFNGNANNNWNGNQQNQHNQYNQHGQHNQGRGGFRGNKKFNNNFHKHNSPAPQQQPEGLANVPKGPKAMTGGPPTGVPTGPAAGNKFSNQQRHQGKEEDNAYMRQPVNPQRAMNRDRGRRGMRNAEYKEL